MLAPNWKDQFATIIRLESVLGWLSRGWSSDRECTLPVSASFLSQRFVRLAAERTRRLIEDAKTEQQAPVVSFGYVGGLARGGHCLIDLDKVAILSTDVASVADSLELLFEQESARFAGSKMIKPKADWPHRSVLMSKHIYLGVKPNHYSRLILRFLALNMAALGEYGNNVKENSIFWVWKTPSVSQRLI